MGELAELLKGWGRHVCGLTDRAILTGGWGNLPARSQTGELLCAHES